jgi:cysteine synthase A
MGVNAHEVVESLLSLIGKTPIVRLQRVIIGHRASILVKLENMNPSGSIKDRMALCMIEMAEKEGRAIPGTTTLIEASSGNTAQAIALVGAIKGYRVRIYLPESTATPEKIYALKRYGAEIELMRGEEEEEANTLAKEAGLHGATTEIPGRLKCLKEERANRDVLWLRQFSNPGNVIGQAEIGRELLGQVGNQIDTFIASVGTGGTFLGVSRRLKESVPDVQCIVVQPVGWKKEADPLSPKAKYVPGITGGHLKEIRDSGIADAIVEVPNEKAIEMAHRMSREEGINCGISSGANLFVALQEANKSGMEHKNIVTLVVDGGYRYVSQERYIT